MIDKEVVPSPDSRGARHPTLVRRSAYIDKLSNRYGLPPLSETEFEKGQYEMRLWSSINSENDRCLILRRTDNGWSSRLVESASDESLAKHEGIQSLPTRTTELTERISDPDDVDRIIAEHTFYPRLPYRRDDPTPPIVDEGVVTLEVRQGERYDVVDYRAFTTSADGKSLVKACKSFEDLFEIEFGCQH